MSNNCSDSAPTTSVFYSDISGDKLIIAFLVIASILGILCLAIYFEEIIFIRRHYKDHDSRAWKIILLLGLYPVVCVTSLIALLVPTSATLIELLASCYLSICIYTFIHMTIDCFGGNDQMVETLANDKIVLSTPPCCCCCCCILKPIKLTRKSLRTIELLSMQVIFVRPVVLFIAAVLWTDGRYVTEMDPSKPYPYIITVSGISTIMSMYGLIVIFRASRQHLTHYHLALKFIPLQLIIIMVNLQNFIFNTLANYDVPSCKGTRGSKVRATNINNSLLVIEAFLCCLLARKGYRTKTPNQDEVLENVPATRRLTSTGLGSTAFVTSNNCPNYESIVNASEVGSAGTAIPHS